MKAQLAERLGLNVLRGSAERTPFSASADAIVIGSGAGGAVVARELARAGLSVIVLEEGAHHPAEEYARYSPSRALQSLAREAGLGVAFGVGNTPVTSVMAGRCVGGSSVLTGGVCFRIPDEVLHRWSTERGLEGISPDTLAPFFEEIEDDLSVSLVPEQMRSRSSELFAEGADKLGIPMKPLRRNTVGCKGAARCNFGCPNGAKMSVDVAVLPEACERGAVIVSDALVESIVVENHEATGVRGRFIDRETGAPGVPFAVHAKLVVAACGALHTPGLLRRSGLATSEVGKNLTLHPSFRVGALFDERVDGWDGAMQSVYSDHFGSDGLTLIGVYTAPSILAAAFPGVGRAHRELVRSLPNLAFFGAMVHDDAGGRVRRWIGREPLITYRMADRDRDRMWRGIGILGEMAFAAGARAVLLPIFGADPITRPEDLRALLQSPPAALARRVECMSFHPLGTARMGRSPAQGTVTANGQHWHVPNLYVADGSVVPTSIGVNSQLPIMALALRIARQAALRFRRAPSLAA